MENLKVASKYELMLIIDARLGQEVKEATYKEISDLIIKNGGKVINGQVWQEKQKMTYKINKVQEGTYYLIKFDADGSLINKIHPALRLNEKLLRFAIINMN